MAIDTKKNQAELVNSSGASGGTGIYYFSVLVPATIICTCQAINFESKNEIIIWKNRRLKWLWPVQAK